MSNDPIPVSVPLVSICTPTYQRPELLRAAIASCRAQTCGDFEMIITDNSPDDRAGAVVASFNDPRLRYYKNEKNLGPFENFIKVAALAQGKYVKFLMDDDLLKPECLARMVAVLEQHPTAGVAMAPMDLVDTESRRIFPRFYMFRKMYYRYRYQVGDGLIGGRRILRDFLTRDYPCCVPSGILVRRECLVQLGPFDPACDFAIDLDMVMRAATRYDFYYLDAVLSSWRYFPVNHTATLHQKGLNIGAFYYITRKILADTQAMSLFPATEHPRLIRDSLFFCSCRSLLNGLAGLRALNLSLVAVTVRTILREDPYVLNWLRLPVFIVREILASFRPPQTPLPKE